MTPQLVIGYIHPGWVRAEFCASLLDTVMQATVPVETVLAYQSGPNISTARNQVARDFLDKRQAQWLLMADTDMVFAPDAPARLIKAANPLERPIVGGLCWSQNAAGDPFPTVYELTEADGRLAFARRTTWPEGDVIRVSATGAAFLLVHRTALQRIEKESKDPAAPWFRESAVGAPLSLMGEDMTFCLRAAAAGIPVHVHTGVQTGHMKPVMLGKVT